MGTRKREKQLRMGVKGASNISVMFFFSWLIIYAIRYSTLYGFFVCLNDFPNK